MDAVKRIIRILVTASALFGVLSRLIFSLQGLPEYEVLLFFTVQSNLMVCAYLLIDSTSELKRRRIAGLLKTADSFRKGFLHRRSTWNAVHGAVLLYISMTGLVYNLLLRTVTRAKGFDAVIAIFNHTVTPLLFLADWLLRQRRYDYSPQLIIPWLAYPVAYFIFGSIEGAITGVFRYPFLDFVSQDVVRYSSVIVLIISFFILGAWIIISVNQLTTRPAGNDS